MIYQYDTGYIPSDLETLSLIEPQVGSVWVSLKDKFEEVSPGKLQNRKLEEVRAFWSKQAKNGEKGGRPQNKEPKPNPNHNPNHNPKENHHTDIDLDTDIELRLNSALDEIYIDNQRSKWQHVNFDFEVNSFKEKVRGSPDDYRSHDTGGIRKAFQYQLRFAKSKDKVNGKRTFSAQDELALILNRPK